MESGYSDFEEEPSRKAGVASHVRCGAGCPGRGECLWDIHLEGRNCFLHGVSLHPHKSQLLESFKHSLDPLCSLISSGL